jgi:hypothetical protein
MCNKLAMSYNSDPAAVKLAPRGPTIVGTGNGTPEVPQLPSA